MFTVTTLNNGVPGYTRKPSYRGVFREYPQERHLKLIASTANLDVSIVRVTTGVN